MPTHYLHNLRFGHTIYMICTHLQYIQDLAGSLVSTGSGVLYSLHRDNVGIFLYFVRSDREGIEG